jgi:putative inorganic carbon (hco3(-)) transporter
MTRTLPTPALLLAAGIATLAATAGLSLGADPNRAFLGAVGAVAVGSVGYLVLRVDPVWPLSLGIAMTVFSGHSGQLGLPLPPDRLLIAAGLVAFALQGAQRVRLQPVHWVMLVAAGWAIVSAVAAGTLRDSASQFALLDAFGLVPFAIFLVAPVVFGDPRRRAILLGTLVACGAYLGLTALAEGLGADALVFPSYIVDEGIGIHADRARGPFVEAVANGMGLYAGAVAGAVGLAVWRDPLVRCACAGVATLCAAGLVFTLTRSIWLGAILASAAALVGFPATRRYLVPAAAAAALLVAVALAVVPGLSQSATEREAEQSSIWVRENTNRAALAMAAERPIAGFGWGTYTRENVAFLEQEGDTPINGVGEGVHNVLLSHASQIGLVGAFLWAAAWLLGIGGAIVRRGPPELLPWRIGLLALAVLWAVVAATTPLPYAFPTIVLWTWAGVVLSGAPRGWPHDRERERWAS